MSSSSRLGSRHLVPALFASAVAVSACGPSVQEAAEDFLPPFCQKLRTCNQAGFDQAYTSIDACVQKGLSAIPEGDRNKRSKCGDEELATCRKDIEAADCAIFASNDLSNMPASCKGC